MRKSFIEDGIVFTNVALIDTKLDELEIPQEIEWYPCMFRFEEMDYMRQYIENDTVIGTLVFLKSGQSIPVSLDYDEFEKYLREKLKHYYSDLKNCKRYSL